MDDSVSIGDDSASRPHWIRQAAGPWIFTWLVGIAIQEIKHFIWPVSRPWIHEGRVSEVVFAAFAATVTVAWVARARSRRAIRRLV